MSLSHGAATLRARTDPGPPVFDDRAPPLPAELDVEMDPDGYAVIYDPADNDARLQSDSGIVYLGDYR